MPLRVATWTGADFITRTGPARVVQTPGFIPGITMPFYIPNADLDLAAKNVGNRKGVALTTYTGTITGGVATLTGSGTYTNILFPCVVDIQGPVTLINCRVVVPTSYTTTSDSIKACVRMLNGASNTGVYMEDCEIHNRAQRPMNGISGRNATIRRLVISGCVDGLSVSATGSTPQLFGFDLQDMIVSDTAWWYSPTFNVDIHSSDTQSHGDGIQHGVAALRVEAYNCVFAHFISENIGIGTPGSGSDTGNPYVPSGYNYIQSQATHNSWRNTYCNTWSLASQSMWDVPQRLVTSGGSQAAAMINRDNIHFYKCYFGGGLATINLMDSNLPTSMNVTIEDCIFYNDMKNPNGHGTAKGYAVQVKTGKTIQNWSNNKWFDGTTVNITYA